MLACCRLQIQHVLPDSQQPSVQLVVNEQESWLKDFGLLSKSLSNFMSTPDLSRLSPFVHELFADG